MEKFHTDKKLTVNRAGSLEETEKNPRIVDQKTSIELPSKTKQGESQEQETKVYSCPFCKRGFPSQRGMKGHITRTHLETVHKLVTGDGLCKLCGLKFIKEKALIWHEKMCTKRRDMFAKKVVKTPGKMMEHEKIHSNNCELCDKSFQAFSKIESIQLVNEHKINEHPTDTEKYREKKNCDDCDFEADSGILLKKHMRDFHQAWDFTRSISPPPKRQKEENENDTTANVNANPNPNNIEFEELISELEDMDLDEEQKRSNQMDQQILEKRKRNDMEEERKLEEESKTSVETEKMMDKMKDNLKGNTNKPDKR